MKRWALILVVPLFVCSILGDAWGTLYDRGSGLIYDDVLDITWLQDANYAISTGYITGPMDWYQAMEWADQLEYMGYDDWRLPSAENVIESPVPGYPAGTELGYLYHIELGNYGSAVFHCGPFVNLEYGSYWLSTEASGGPDPGGQFAKVFVVNLFTEGKPVGMIMDTWKMNAIGRAWAVRDGDVTPVPEPTSGLLLLTGIVGLYVFRKKSRPRPTPLKV